MFNKNKKAQGLSITTIIVAAIAVVVLVVLVAIFTGRIGIFSAVLGTTSAEMSKDSALYKCLPPKTTYEALERAQVEYNKDPSPQNKKTLEDAKTKKATELSNCKDKPDNACANTCQWVG